MDSGIVLVLCILLIIAVTVYWFVTKTQGSKDLVDRIVYVSKNLHNLKIVEKQGKGFTGAANEKQLVNEQLSILYTATKRDDHTLVETAHIMLSPSEMLVMTRVNYEVTVLGGNYYNIKDPVLPSEARWAITQIFQRIDQVISK